MRNNILPFEQPKNHPYTKRIKTATEQYSDDIVVLALDTVDRETIDLIRHCLRYDSL